MMLAANGLSVARNSTGVNGDSMMYAWHAASNSLRVMSTMAGRHGVYILYYIILEKN